MAKVRNNEYTPDYVSPPGETLQELLAERQMSQAELARRTGRPDKTINEIIQGKAALTPQTALQLEHVLGIPAGFWNNREQTYRAFLAAQAERAELQEQADWLHCFPVKEMAQRGWIKFHEDIVEQIRELLKFFGVASPAQWQASLATSDVAYRRSPAFRSQPHALSAWLRQGELLAQRINCEPYQADKFYQALTEARSLTKLEPDTFIPELQMRCAAAGVAVIFVEEVSGARVSGATRWLNSQKALLQLSFRYQHDDQVWFSFFHEAGHVLLHGKRQVFIEEEGAEDEQEEEANQFAANLLIPKGALQSFLDRQIPGRYPSKQSLIEFAEEQGIAPGIVVGRLQHDYPTVIPKTHHNRLKRRLIRA